MCSFRAIFSFDETLLAFECWLKHESEASEAMLSFINCGWLLFYITIVTICDYSPRTHPASRASLNSSKKEEKERLRKSCHFFEVAAVHISGLVTPVLCRQTGFTVHVLFLLVNRMSRQSRC